MRTVSFSFAGVKIMKKLRFFVLVLLACSMCAFATNGIAVSVSNEPFEPHESSPYYYTVYKYEIENDKVISKTALYRQSWQYHYVVSPVINMEGTHVAFMRCTPNGNFVSVVGIDGGDVGNVAEFPKSWDNINPMRSHDGRFCDWPAGDWVYYMPDGVSMRRVKYNDPSSDEASMTFQSPVWQWQLNAYANRIYLTAAGHDNPYGIQGHPFPFDGKLYQSGACGSCLSPSGTYFAFQQGTGHADLSIKTWEGDAYDESMTESFYCADFKSHNDPNMGCGKVYHRWANNSDEWALAMVGRPGGNERFCENGCNQVLINIKDRRMINVSNHSEKLKSGAGDFWLSGPESEMYSMGSVHSEDFIERAPSESRTLSDVTMKNMPHEGIYLTFSRKTRFAWAIYNSAGKCIRQGTADCRNLFIAKNAARGINVLKVKSLGNKFCAAWKIAWQ
jgi:hypothetical protein